MLKRFSPTTLAGINGKALLAPDGFKKVLEFASSLKGEQWEQMLDVAGSDRRRSLAAIVGAFARSEQSDKWLVAAGPDGRRSLWEITERLLSTFARRKDASTARGLYAARWKRDPRLDSSLAIRLAAGAAVGRVVDGDLTSLPRWSVWPLLELEYETRPTHLYPFVTSLVAVEQLLLAPSTVDEVVEGKRPRSRLPDADVLSHLDAVRQQVARAVARISDRDITDIHSALSPRVHVAKNRPKDWVYRMFYFGVRLTYEQAGLGKPTAKDLADLALCWDIEPASPTRIRARWRDRVEPYAKDFERNKSKRRSTSSRST